MVKLIFVLAISCLVSACDLNDISYRGSNNTVVCGNGKSYKGTVINTGSTFIIYTKDKERVEVQLDACYIIQENS